MSSGWSFPGNNNGQINGISEAGIETFKGALMASLTREICQNSLDAALKEVKHPVSVEFDVVSFNTEEIPGYMELREAIESCYDFWNELKNEKACKFFSKAIQLISQKEIKILRISDYGTEGLTGSDKAYNTPWQNLVKSNGVSSKGASAGGSFGIGKSAPFACSGIRTVFYRTLDKNGLNAVQGIARLVSYKKSTSDEITTGIGYYGRREKNTSIESLEILDRISKREESGTDLFVFGFEHDTNWQQEMIVELLEGFMLAFLREKLVVKVGDIEINKKTLSTLMEQYKNEANTAYSYYRVMDSRNDTKLFKQEFEEMGNVNLRVLLAEDLNRKVLISRESGMKLFDKDRISSTIQFSAVLDMEGEELNGFFRKMESPQHNAWEQDRYEENPTRAKKLKSKLYKWIKDTILEVGKYGEGDEMDIVGIGDLLPDFFEYSQEIGEQKEETISDVTNDWNFKIANEIENIYEQESVSGEQPGEEVLIEYGEITEEGTDSKDIPICDTNNSAGGTGAPAEAQLGEGNRPFGVMREIKVQKMRLFMSNKERAEYVLSFELNKELNKGYFGIHIAGEQSNIKTNIQSAECVGETRLALKCQEERIEVNHLKKGVRHKIVFRLKEDEIYSLEVKLYASE